MKHTKWISAGIVVVAVSLMLGAWLRPKGGEEIACAPMQLSRSTGDQVGFEFLDLQQREVWATTDFTVDEFEAFQFPWTWRVLWQKNQPRILLADSGTFLKSPDCEREGEFTQTNLFDRNFIKVVHLNRLYEPLDDDGLVRLTTLEKYHIVQFNVGTTINVLEGPDGTQYVLLTRSVHRTTDHPSLPSDWTITAYDVVEDLEVSLSGEVGNIRLDNDDSYQGPLPADLDFARHLAMAGE
ncbi:MAG: hypothetical protein AAFV33_14580 [Chloroflexota bacterium]